MSHEESLHRGEVVDEATRIAKRTRDIKEHFRATLPREAFLPRPRTLLYAVAQWAQIIAGIAIVAHSSSLPIKMLGAALAGHAVFCMTIVAHSVSHGTVVRKLRFRYPIEVLLWTPTFIATTAWIILHHEFHHNHSNTTRDVYLYRYFTKRERRVGATLYGWLFHPHRYLPWNPLVLIPAIGATLFPVFNALFNIPMPNSPEHCSVYRFSRRERLRIAFETAIMVGYQVGLGMCFGMENWIWMGLAPSLIGAFLGMFYINTQHHTRPLLDINDPIGSSASVKLPRILEILHMNFGHHVEHHIFPGMDNHYYPMMTADLRRLLGSEYNEVSFAEAYRIMFRSGPFKDPHQTKGVAPKISTGMSRLTGPTMPLSS